jgi:hypothetical protein
LDRRWLRRDPNDIGRRVTEAMKRVSNRFELGSGGRILGWGWHRMGRPDEREEKQV